MQKAWPKGKSIDTEIYRVFSNIGQRKYKYVIEWTAVSMQTRRLLNNISSPKQFHAIRVNSEILSRLLSTCYICVTQLNLTRGLCYIFLIVLSLKKRLTVAVKINTIFGQYQNELMIKLTCQKLLFWRLQHIKSITMLLFL